MHSRIIQVSRKPKPKYIKKRRYEEGNILPSLVDWVSDETNINDDKEWLKDLLGGVAEFDKTKFTIINKRAYFEQKYHFWLSQIEPLMSTTLDEYANVEEVNGKPSYFSLLDVKMIFFQKLYDDKYGIYMDDNDEENGIQTLDQFMRRTKEGDVWYIGRTFDYHW